MAKKDKTGNKKAEGLCVNKTAKFAVLDLPGVTQPDISAVADEATPSSSATAKDGLQGRRANASTGPRIEGSTKLIGGDSFVQRSPNPDWLKTRESVYGKIKSRREQELVTKTPVDITVVMPDGKELRANSDGTPFQAWKTSPYDVALVISQGLADSATVARVTYANFVDDYSPKDDGMEGEDTLMDAMQDGGLQDDSTTTSEKTFLWDMMRPLVGPVAKLELLKFDGDQDAKTVFWHSSAHMLGEALEHLYGCKLTIGPPLAGGFYYDSYMGKDALREEDCEYNAKCEH
jgi:threonyl-tRNA synthetase